MFSFSKLQKFYQILYVCYYQLSNPWHYSTLYTVWQQIPTTVAHHILSKNVWVNGYWIFDAIFQISIKWLNHIMFIKEKGRKQNLVSNGCFIKQNRLIAQNEYIEHRLFNNKLSECLILPKRYNMKNMMSHKESWRIEQSSF